MLDCNRKVLVRRQGRWEQINFKQLSKGDNFLLFEPNGKRVCTADGENIFCAISLPYYCAEMEAWTVDTF